jgi:hypothetical protein
MTTLTFIIKKIAGDVYVAKRPGKRSFTPVIAFAHRYENRYEAERECKNGEIVVSVFDLGLDTP